MISAILRCVDVEAGDIEAGPGELDRQRQADVAQTDDADRASVRATIRSRRGAVAMRDLSALTRAWRPACGTRGAARSASTIISTSCLKSTPGVQPSSVRAFDAVAEQMIDFGRPQQRRIDAHVLLPVEADARERDLDQLAHRVADAGGDDVVVGLVLLQHQPHRAHVVAGKSPVAMRVEIADRQRVGEPELDPRDAVGHLARDELEAAPRRLVVEEHPRHREQIVALAVVHRDVVGEHLRDAVRAARIERRQLGLRHLADLAEHLARRGLVEADLRIDAAEWRRARASRPAS